MSRRLVVMAFLVPAGFLLGGLAGWAHRPTEWTVGIRQTAHIAINAATYGHAYESQAERVLLYFVYGGMLGAMVAVLIILVLTKHLRGKPSPARE